jgi:hypothetical protein
MLRNFHISQNQPLFANDLTDPWETDPLTTEISPKAPPGFIRKIEAKIRHDSEHLMTAATLDVPLIAAPKPPEGLRPDRLLLQDAIKIHGFDQLQLGQAIVQALALLWWSNGNRRGRAF